jgi:hypothetical protein
MLPEVASYIPGLALMGVIVIVVLVMAGAKVFRRK